jgi:hypothetical protein
LHSIQLEAELQFLQELSQAVQVIPSPKKPILQQQIPFFTSEFEFVHDEHAERLVHNSQPTAHCWQLGAVPKYFGLQMQFKPLGEELMSGQFVQRVEVQLVQPVPHATQLLILE